MPRDQAVQAESVDSGPATEFRPGRPPVVYLRGELDVSDAGQLRRTLLAICAPHTSVVVSMADVTFVDGAVVGVLAQANSRFSDGLVVRGAPAMVARVFKIVELDHLLHS